jgi:ankyrin repeat protein
VWKGKHMFEGKNPLNAYANKTTFSAAVAEKLLSEHEGEGTIGVASVFLDPDDIFVDDRLTFGVGGVSAGHRFLQTISQQLRSDDAKAEPQPGNIEDLRAVISTTCMSFDKTYIIVDGLDRCPAASRHELEDEITTLVEYGCYVMITNYLGQPVSRIVEHTCKSCEDEYLDHHRYCKDCDESFCDDCIEEQDCLEAEHTVQRHAEAAVSLGPDDEGTSRFIAHELDRHLEQRDFDDELHKLVETQRERIEDAIAKKSGGVLVICKALLGYLRDCQRAAYEEIMNVQTHVLRPEEELFDTLMSKVKLQSPENVKIALTVFCLVSQISTGSAMSFEEMTNALELLNIGKAINEQDLYALCQGMLQVGDRNIVEAFHDDFKVYLQENCNEDFRPVYVDLADLTVRGLAALPCFDRWTVAAEQSLKERLSQNEFLGYAAPKWGDCVQQSAAYRKFDERQTPPVGSLIQQAISILQDSRKLATCLYLANCCDQHFDLWPGCHALHICAWFGLTKFIGYFVATENSSIDVVDPVYGRTPLMVAASRGHTDFARRIIELGADVSFQPTDGRSALLEAVEYDAVQQGYYDTTKLILEHTSKPTQQGPSPDTTALIACIRTSIRVSRRNHAFLNLQLLNLLLDHPSTDVNETTSDGHTAIMEAVGVGCRAPEIIDLLLRHRGTKLDLRDRTGKTAFHLSVEKPHNRGTAIDCLLRSAHCTPEILNICDSDGMTAAMLLLRNDMMDNDEVVPILRSMSNAGADLACADRNGRGLLHAAAVCERASAVDYLHLEKKLPLDSTDAFGWCPLHYASGMRAPETVDRLLRLGASAELCDRRGWSPIDIVNCDNPEDHYVQLICALPSWSSLPNYSTAETSTRRRPAWSFATCDVAEFQQQLHDPADDFWLPDPKHGNLVGTIRTESHIQ